MMKRANISPASPASTSFGLAIVKHGGAYPTAKMFIKEVSSERRNRGGGDGEISGEGRGRKPHAKVTPPLSSLSPRPMGEKGEREGGRVDTSMTFATGEGRGSPIMRVILMIGCVSRVEQ